MQTDWQGYYLDGKTAARYPITLSITTTGLKGTTENGQTLWWPYERIHQTQGFNADEQIRLELEGVDHEAIIIPESGFLLALHQYFPERVIRLHNPARRRARTQFAILAALASIGIAIGLYTFGIPAFAAMVATWVPVSWEEALGRSALDSLAPIEKRCIEPRRTEIVNRIMKVLMQPVTTSPYTFQIVVVDSYLVNAFALPGGTIVLFRGLLLETKRPEQLAGVLAHEIQHILKRHTTRTLLQQASTGLLLSAVTGNATGLGANGVEGARILGLLRYSRQNEEEADRGGLQMLQETGIDPQGMIEFFEMLRKKEKDTDGRPIGKYLSTHPATEDRIEKLKSLIDKTVHPSTLLFREDDWSDMRKICDITAAEGGNPH